MRVTYWMESTRRESTKVYRSRRIILDELIDVYRLDALILVFVLHVGAILT